MHPDVWAATNAERWNYYYQLRMAYEDGREDAKFRRGNPVQAKTKMDDLIKRATGQ